MIGLANKGQIPWSKGLTKENDLRLLNYSIRRKGEKRSKTAKFNISIGCKNKYLNTSEREKTSFYLKEYYSKPESKQKLLQRIKNFSNHGAGSESLSHKNTKIFIKKCLVENGYVVNLEKFITINNKHYAIDLYAKKDGNVVLIEVGDCDNKKLYDLQENYPVVLKVPKISRS
jgi:hypothetical protein